jgi:hypothetical protein
VLSLRRHGPDRDESGALFLGLCYRTRGDRVVRALCRLRAKALLRAETNLERKEIFRGHRDASIGTIDGPAARSPSLDSIPSG